MLPGNSTNQIEAAQNSKDNLILNMTQEKRDKSSELSKHWSPDSTMVRNEVIMKTTYPLNQESATESVVTINNSMM